MRIDKIIQRLEEAGFSSMQLARLDKLAGDPPTAMVYKAALSGGEKRGMTPSEVMGLVEETTARLSAVLNPPQED